MLFIIPIFAYLSVVLPHSQLSLFSSTTWSSSPYRSLRVSDSVSLSSNTCCRGSASLLSDGAESSPPFPSYPPCLPLSLSSPCTHTCIFLFLFWGEHKHSLLSISCSLSPLMSPLCSLSISTSPLFSWSVYDRELPVQAVGVALLCICLSESVC